MIAALGVAALGVAALGLSACKEDGVFFCSDDDQCMQAGAVGICQDNDLCSFPRDDCPSGQAYGKYAGTLAGRCVEVEDDGSSSGTTAATGLPVPTEPTEESSSSTTTEPLTSATSESTGSPEGSSSSTGPGTELPPNGSLCENDEDCASGACYASILGSVCGECLTDADCEFGCTPPYPLDPSQQWAQCNGGELGDSCETSSASPSQTSPECCRSRPAVNAPPPTTARARCCAMSSSTPVSFAEGSRARTQAHCSMDRSARSGPSARPLASITAPQGTTWVCSTSGSAASVPPTPTVPRTSSASPRRSTSRPGPPTPLSVSDARPKPSQSTQCSRRSISRTWVLHSLMTAIRAALVHCASLLSWIDSSAARFSW